MMPAVAAFAMSDTGRFLAAAGIDVPFSDPIVALNYRAVQVVMAHREEPEPDFEAKYG
jgi:hypothetical protein